MDETRLESSLISNCSSYSSISTNIRPTSQIVISNPTITNKKPNFSAIKSVLKVTLCKDVEEKSKNEEKDEQVRLRRPRKENLAKFRETIVISDQSQCDNAKALTEDVHDVTLDVIQNPHETVIVLGETDPLSKDNLTTYLDPLSKDHLKSYNKIKGSQEQVECPECNKKLKMNSFNAHVKTHLGVKPYACSLCWARFTRRGDVTRHKRLIHETPRKFMCPRCGKYFLNAEDLDSHMENHEAVCPVCGDSFMNAVNLATHMKDHEKRPTFKCTVCQYSFGKQIYYESHIKYVHPDGNAKQPDDSQLQDVQVGEKRSKVDLHINNVQVKPTNKGKIPMILKNKTKKLPNNPNYICEQKIRNSKDNVNLVVGKSYPLDVEIVPEEVDTIEETEPLQIQQMQSIEPQIIDGKQYIYKDESNGVQYIYNDKSTGVQYIYKDKANDEQYLYYKDESNDGQENYEADENQQVYMIVDSDLMNSQDMTESNEESGDAVQTLIDAVQQLIQTHEANNTKVGVEKQVEETNKKAILLQKKSVVEKLIESNGGQHIVQIGQHMDLEDFC